jgi:phage terminase Nu1 subunit (DNA packaging protein)
MVGGKPQSGQGDEQGRDSMGQFALTLPRLAELVGVKYRTLHTWLQRGLLTASCAQARGSGSRNIFDREDAIEALVRHMPVEVPFGE